MQTLDRAGYVAFDWLRDEQQFEALLRRLPELVVGHSVAILSYDSGFFIPNAAGLARGWRRAGNISISPRLTDPGEMPIGTFDEWMVFDDAVPDLGAAEPWVNWGDFSPIDFAWDEKRDAFWAQLQRLQPRSVIAGGTRCYVVTRDDAVIARLRHEA